MIETNGERESDSGKSVLVTQHDDDDDDDDDDIMIPKQSKL